MVRAGYAKMARQYLAERGRLKTDKYVHQLLKYLPENATILDLGCGAGVPVDDILLAAGHSVVGIDIASEQIKLAKKNCPWGEYLVGDITQLKRDQYRVDAIVSFYTIFHVPRREQGVLLKIWASYLRRGGILLITMGDVPFEGEHVLYGEPMWSSQYGTGRNVTMVREAGLKILLDKIDTSGGERHQIIMAQKL